MYVENQRRNVHEAQQNMGQYIYFGTYHISDQRTPRRDCALAQSGQGIRCSHDINHGRRVRRTSAFINLVLQLATKHVLRVTLRMCDQSHCITGWSTLFEPEFCIRYKLALA